METKFSEWKDPLFSELFLVRIFHISSILLRTDCIGDTGQRTYGVQSTSAMHQKNYYGVQFHPKNPVKADCKF